MKKITIYFLSSLFFVQLALAATAVPHRFHFQSVFYDTGGNPLASGSYTARFAILDQSSQPVYTEEQQVDLVNGVVSTMVGDGFAVGSNLATPTGGIATNLINPNQKYYLQAEIQGDTHTLEIGSVPYAHFSEEALSVSAGSITSEAIAEKSITRHHLSDELESAIFGAVAGDRLPTSVASSTDLQNHINARTNAHPAQAISVVGPFANSNSISVEGVLGDFDRAIELQSHNLDAAVSGLQSRIDGVNTSLQSQISSVNTSLQSQISSVNSSLQSQISTNQSAMETRVNSVEHAVETHDHSGPGQGGSLPYSMRPFAFASVDNYRDGCGLRSQYNFSRSDNGNPFSWPTERHYCRLYFANSIPSQCNGTPIVLVTHEFGSEAGENWYHTYVEANRESVSIESNTGGASVVVFVGGC